MADGKLKFVIEKYSRRPQNEAKNALSFLYLHYLALWSYFYPQFATFKVAIKYFLN